MENYESLGVIGEGTYGVVIKARHRETGQVVAIKKFKESDEDEQVRKTSLREVRVLKQLRHDNVITLLEVFRRKGKLHLVFEYVEKTILEVLEKKANGLDDMEVRKYTYQLLRGLEYIHGHNVIHRDVKPENILISRNGALKLCDFGFARTMSVGGKYTDYVATRWYRPPELLVGDTEYNKSVDVWAVGCIFAEISNGIPLYPGESDLDQLAHIMRCFGKVTNRHAQIFRRNPLYANVDLPPATILEPLEARLPNAPRNWLGFLKACLRNDPDDRETCSTLMSLPYFTDRNFRSDYEEELKMIFDKEARINGLTGRSRAGGSRGQQQQQQPPPLAMQHHSGGEGGGGGGMEAALPQTRQQPQQPPQTQPSAQGPGGAPLGNLWSQYLQSATTELPELGGGGGGGGGSHAHTPTPMFPTTLKSQQPPGPPQHPHHQPVIGAGGGLGGGKHSKTGSGHGMSSMMMGAGPSSNSNAGGMSSMAGGGVGGAHHAYSSNYTPHDPMMVTGSVKNTQKKNSGHAGSLFPTLGSNAGGGSSYASGKPPSGGDGGGGSIGSQISYKKKPQKKNVLSTLSLTAYGAGVGGNSGGGYGSGSGGGSGAYGGGGGGGGGGDGGGMMLHGQSTATKGSGSRGGGSWLH